MKILSGLHRSRTVSTAGSIVFAFPLYGLNPQIVLEGRPLELLVEMAYHRVGFISSL